MHLVGISVCVAYLLYSNLASDFRRSPHDDPEDEEHRWEQRQRADGPVSAEPLVLALRGFSDGGSGRGGATTAGGSGPPSGRQSAPGSRVEEPPGDS